MCLINCNVLVRVSHRMVRTELASSIAKLVNLSLSTGMFSLSLKASKSVCTIQRW